MARAKRKPEVEEAPEAVEEVDPRLAAGAAIVFQVFDLAGGRSRLNDEEAAAVAAFRASVA